MAAPARAQLLPASFALTLRRTPPYPSSDNMGICLFHVNCFAESRALFLRALQLQPEYSDAKGWLARVDEKLAAVATDAQLSAKAEALTV